MSQIISLSPAHRNGADPAFCVEEQVAHLLRRAHQRACALFLSSIGADNLTPTQFFALARLHEQGPVSQNHLGRLAAMDPATVQGVVRRLSERGMITRAPHPQDRRRTLLTLTKDGEALIAGLLDSAQEADARLLGRLSSEERVTFLALLRRIT
ncbi:MarR family winged helix-turn-helix transcriptional regulator [Aquibaculum arenosum]|uniref:MarR family transcriptional regulator n=1 Tax=Aquibaculum arenosum TaxID=3032591 RepID=A0ABT5YKB4_9PROT|nr:MarR family transcriptional regulator [Fodinicurvata sp. CAU 1616]MDF2095230.1 MarR family transcriptional regulator [Fodinicurvata sp. CAU 1616]